MQISQTFGKNLLVVSPVLLLEKILLAKLCKWIKKLTSSPGVESLLKITVVIFDELNFSSYVVHV